MTTITVRQQKTLLRRETASWQAGAIGLRALVKLAYPDDTP